MLFLFLLLFNNRTEGLPDGEHSNVEYLAEFHDYIYDVVPLTEGSYSKQYCCCELHVGLAGRKEIDLEYEENGHSVEKVQAIKWAILGMGHMRHLNVLSQMHHDRTVQAKVSYVERVVMHVQWLYHSICRFVCYWNRRASDRILAQVS